MQPRRITIVGVGLLGGSMGLALRSRAKDCKIVGYGHRRETLDAALQMHALHEGYEQPGPAVRGSDLVVLCTPVGLLRPMLEQIAPLLDRGALVTDVGSTKRSVVEAAEAILPAHARFVGSHPMAGSERRGIGAARADLYDHALCIVTRTERTDLAALEQIESFWRLLGMRTCRTTPEEHDRRLADISHLPHAVAAALVAIQEDPSLALTGKGFLDLTRIAGGDSVLWRDIFLDNRDNVRKSIRHLSEQLKTLSDLLEPGKAEALQAWLEQSARRRQKLLDEKKQST
jgi:prephenate dehydrogenase